MAVQAAASEESTTLSWWDPNPIWGEHLTRFSVLAYFARSPFFDHNSNNAKAMMRGLDQNYLGHLEQMGPGVEFVLHHAQEPWLFVIRKQQRISSKEQLPLALYNIIDKQVTQAASLHAILGARLQRCLHSIRTSFSLMQSDLSPLHQLVRAHERKQEQQQQQRREQEGQQQVGAQRAEQQEGRAEGQQHEEQQQGLAKGSPPSELRAPIPVRKPPSKEEVDRLGRTDEIIMRVLATYSRAGLLPALQQPTASALPVPSTAPSTPQASQQQIPVASQGGSEISEPAAKRARR